MLGSALFCGLKSTLLSLGQFQMATGREQFPGPVCLAWQGLSTELSVEPLPGSRSEPTDLTMDSGLLRENAVKHLTPSSHLSGFGLAGVLRGPRGQFVRVLPNFQRTLTERVCV